MPVAEGPPTRRRLRTSVRREFEALTVRHAGAAVLIEDVGEAAVVTQGKSRHRS